MRLAKLKTTKRVNLQDDLKVLQQAPSFFEEATPRGTGDRLEFWLFRTLRAELWSFQNLLTE
jgi:hypothetical protein